MKLFSKDQQILLLTLGFFCFVVNIFGKSNKPLSILSSTTSDSYQQWVVEVSGTIKKSGIYIFDFAPNFYDIIQKLDLKVAKNTDLKRNFFNKLPTGTLIQFTSSCLSDTAPLVSIMDTAKTFVLGIPTDINLAHVYTLSLIPGISNVLAQRIVQYRSTHGVFTSWRDLLTVKGVGTVTLKKLRNNFQI